MESVNLEPTLIRSAQAAHLLTISERKLWQLTNAGKVPYVRIGRSVRYDPDDLLHWIETQKEFPRQ